jgi:CheY-like chemotaxis protein
MAVFQNQEIEKEAENKESAAPKEKIASARSMLVVDDSEVNRDLLLRMLTLKGYEARAVSSAEAALESLRVKSFDIMLIDCVMPEMDGYALAQKIRAEDISQQKGLQSALPRPVLIAMSPRHDQEEAEKCAKAGFDSLLVKPFTMTALDQQIRLIFDDKRIG